MATFPKTENGIGALAAEILNGLTQHAELFPSVTEVSKTALADSLVQYSTARTAQQEAQAAAKVATQAKSQRSFLLERQVKGVLLLCEHDSVNHPENLDYIGWGTRKDPTALQKPGNFSGLTPTYEGPGIVTLRWDKPHDGGSVANYRIERSDQPEGGGIPGPWTLITTSFTNELRLENQPRGIEMQYRIIATNAAGDSMPSNIATVVL